MVFYYAHFFNEKVVARIPRADLGFRPFHIGNTTFMQFWFASSKKVFISSEILFVGVSAKQTVVLFIIFRLGTLNSDSNDQSQPQNTLVAIISVTERENNVLRWGRQNILDKHGIRVLSRQI